MGNPGTEDLPIRPAVWRQRRGQHYDRRECGVGSRGASSRQRRGVAPHHSGRRICAETAGYVVPDLFPELVRQSRPAYKTSAGVSTGAAIASTARSRLVTRYSGRGVGNRSRATLVSPANPHTPTTILVLGKRARNWRL